MSDSDFAIKGLKPVSNRYASISVVCLSYFFAFGLSQPMFSNLERALLSSYFWIATPVTFLFIFLFLANIGKTVNLWGFLILRFIFFCVVSGFDGSYTKDFSALDFRENHLSLTLIDDKYYDYGPDGETYEYANFKYFVPIAYDLETLEFPEGRLVSNDCYEFVLVGQNGMEEIDVNVNYSVSKEVAYLSGYNNALTPSDNGNRWLDFPYYVWSLILQEGLYNVLFALMLFFLVNDKSQFLNPSTITAKS